MTFYAALDVGVRNLALCIIDGDSEVRLERNLPSKMDDVVTCLRGFGEGIEDVRLELHKALLDLDRRVKALAHKDEVRQPLMRLSSPIRPMLVAARRTPNGADHEKKRDPRGDEITEAQTTELDSRA